MGPKKLGVQFIFIFEGSKTIGVQFFGGNKNNWGLNFIFGSNLFYFEGPKKLRGQHFYFGVQKIGVKFLFLGSKKIGGSNLGGGKQIWGSNYFYFLWDTKKWGPILFLE